MLRKSYWRTKEGSFETNELRTQQNYKVDLELFNQKCNASNQLGPVGLKEMESLSNLF